MIEYWQILLLFGVGCAAGFINVMAGGGSTLTLPVLIFLGLDGALANGTNRVAIFLQNATAIKSFKDSNYSNFKQSAKLAMLTLPGGIIGALVAVRLSDEMFKIILGVIMIGIIISMIIPRKKNIYEYDPNKKISVPMYLAMFGIGFYGGFIQVGVGIIIMSALHYLMKLNLVHVNMHKVFVVFVYTIPALAIFIWTGNVNWYLGLSLAAGNALGGWWAAKLSVKKGEGFIKIVMIVAVGIMSLKLLGVF